ETKELRLDGLYKGSLAVAHYAQRLKDRLQKTRYAEEIRLKRKALGRKVLKTGGILYAEDARRIIKDREATDLKKAQARVARAKRKVEKEEAAPWLAMLKEDKKKSGPPQRVGPTIGHE